MNKNGINTNNNIMKTVTLSYYLVLP